MSSTSGSFPAVTRAMEGDCTVQGLLEKLWNSLVPLTFPLVRTLVFLDGADHSAELLRAFAQFTSATIISDIECVPNFAPSICVFLVDSFNLTWTHFTAPHCSLVVVLSGSQTIFDVENASDPFESLILGDWDTTEVTYKDSLGKSHNLSCDVSEKQFPLKTLEGTTLRLSMFLKNGSIEYEDGVLGGFDGYIINTLKWKLRFDIEPVIGWQEEKYGYKLSNGSFVGTLGDVIHGRADLAANTIFIKDYGSEVITFTAYVSSEELCVAVPSSQPKPHWKTIFLCFDVIVWLMIIVSYLLAVLLWYVIVKFYLKKNVSLPGASILIYKIFIGAAIVIPERSEQRRFLATLMFVGIILSSCFNGSLLSLLKSRAFEKEINTLDELNDSGWPIFTHSKNLLDTFKDPGLAKKLMFTENYEDLVGSIAEYRNFCSIGRKSETIQQAIILPKYYGKAPVHVVRECPRNYFLSFVMRRDSPFYSQINDVLLRMSSAGLFKAYFVARRLFFSWEDLEHHESTETHSLGLKNVAIAFSCLGLGVAASFVLFLGEVFLEKCRKIVARRKRKTRNRRKVDIERLSYDPVPEWRYTD